MATTVQNPDGSTPIAVTSSVLPTGAATAANQATANASLASIDGKITAVNTGAVVISAALPAGNNNIGDVDAIQSGTWTVQPGNTANTTAWKVDGSAVTQPVSGTVTANLGTIAGVATAVKQPALGTAGTASADVLTVQGITSMTPLLATLSGTNTIATVTTVTAVTAITNALPAGNNNIGDVDVATLPALVAGTANIGDVDVLTVPADPFGVNADAASATGSISAKLRFIAGTGIPITGTVTVGSHAVTNAGTFAVQSTSTGDVASDGVDSGNPVKVGALAKSADITAVADADRVNLIASLLGKAIVLPYATPALTWSYAGAAGGLVTTSGVTAKAAGTGSQRQYVTSVQVINSHQTIGTEVVIRDGAAGTVLWRGWAQAAGGGCAAKFDPPLRGTAATLVEIAEVTTTATAGVLVNLQGFTAAE